MVDAVTRLEEVSVHQEPLGAPPETRWDDIYQNRILPILRYGRRNKSLVVGLAMLSTLLLFTLVSSISYDTSTYRPLSAPTRLPPSLEYPFGTDTQGRDLFAMTVRGIPLTLQIGLIAGLVSVALGTITAFFAAYYGRWVDASVRTLVDVGLAMPGLLILILVRLNLGRELAIWEMGLALAIVGWVFSSRPIRSQVLVMRETPYVEIARQSGTSGMGIIFKEMMPNLIPYITASLVVSVAGAILASIGLEAVGLGDFSSPTLGMIIYWNIQFSSIILGMWWWWLPALITIVIVFVSLFLISAGLDEWSNPRLRKRV